MAMVVVDDSSLQVDSQPKSGGLVWGSAAAWRCSTFTRWTEWNLAMTSVMVTALNKYRGYYYYYYCPVEGVSGLDCAIWRSRPQYATSNFILLTTFPNVELTDETRTIGDAKLNNAVVVQRMKWCYQSPGRHPIGRLSELPPADFPSVIAAVCRRHRRFCFDFWAKILLWWHVLCTTHPVVQHLCLSCRSSIL